MQRARRFVIYLMTFGLARGGLFVAPIILANLLTPSAYGRLEFAQALATIGATVLALGTSGVVPLVLIRKIDTASWNSVLVHHLVVATLLILCALLGLFAEWPPIVWLAALVTTGLMFQVLWSATLKSQGHAEASLLLDTGVWGLMAIAVITSYMLTTPPVNRWSWAIAALSGYITALAVYTSWRLMRSDSHTNILTYTSTLRTGMPLMASTLLTLLATTSGRLGLGLLSTPEMMADYAILFRATALPIVAHQIIIIARFRQVFEQHTTELEKRLPIMIGLVTGSVILFWLLSGFIDVLLGPAFIKAFSQYRVEGLLILSQCILWSAIALNDLVNARSQTAGPVARATLLYFVLVLPVAWWFLSSRQISLSLFVPVHSIVMAGYFMTQAMVMRSRGIRLIRTWSLTLAAFSGLSAMAFVS